jgi:hypothetical protein
MLKTHQCKIVNAIYLYLYIVWFWFGRWMVVTYDTCITISMLWYFPHLLYTVCVYHVNHSVYPDCRDISILNSYDYKSTIDNPANILNIAIVFELYILSNLISILSLDSRYPWLKLNSTRSKVIITAYYI